MKTLLRPLLCAVSVASVGCLGTSAWAQAPSSAGGGAPAASPAPASSGAASGGSSAGSSGSSNASQGSKFLGKDVPFLDSSNDIVTWDGKNINPVNNRLFRARFEKYLNAPESTSQEEMAYWKLLNDIMEKLAPQTATKQSLDEAWLMLDKAANYEIDAGLCDRIADSVYNVWQAKGEEQRLQKANDALKREIEIQQWNAESTYNEGVLDRSPSDKGPGAAQWRKERDEKRKLRLAPYLEDIAENKATVAANKVKKEFSEATVKLSFQALTVQFLTQRRYLHVMIANRFYRALYNQGQSEIKVADEMKANLTKGAKIPVTMEMIDSLAGEAIRDVKEGVDAFKFLVEKDEMASATDRLSEAFAMGEYMPQIRTLPREEKRKALAYSQKANQLMSAIEVKDFVSAESLLTEIQKVAKDFDPIKASVAIQTSKSASNFHLAKAKVAATSNDKATFESEFQKAVEAWPTNPALAEAGSKVFEQSDAQQQTINDFNRLVAQKNYRQIYDDKERFIVYTALVPEKRDELKQILSMMTEIEGTIIRANEVARMGNAPGAWESVEKMIQRYPDDTKLNQVRGNYSTDAADFVRSVRTAQKLEEQSEYGSSLAWYLKAQRSYPASDFAREGIDRMVKIILPEHGRDSTASASAVPAPSVPTPGT